MKRVDKGEQNALPDKHQSDGLIRLVLADDHPFVAMGLQQVITDEEGFQILATCRDGREALQAVKDLQPDILLLDIQMPVLDGLAVLRELKAEDNPVKVIILTGTLDEEQPFEAMRLGARGVLLKEMAPNLLIQCLKKVSKGEIWLEKRTTGLALEKMLRQEAGKQQVARILTQREIELVNLVATGLDNAQIAEKLFISPNTVKVHLHRIYEKLGVKNRLALTLYAQEKGLV